MSAGSSFKLFVALGGGGGGNERSEEGPESLQHFIEATYNSLRWPPENAKRDLEALRDVFIETLNNLRDAFHGGYQYKLPIPILAVDATMARLDMCSKQPKFAFTAEKREQVDSLLSKYRQHFEALGILMAGHLEILTKKGWKKLDLPVGLKVKVESLASGVPSLAMNNSPSPQLPYILSSPTRMIVQTAAGERYEIDRYCPHKGADLLGAPVIDSTVECPKHRWKFDLRNGGACLDGKFRCTLNSHKLDW